MKNLSVFSALPKLFLLLLLLLLLLTEGGARPGRSRRSGVLCSARDIRQMANNVCNFARRSVRSQPPSSAVGTDWLLHLERQNRFAGARHEEARARMGVSAASSVSYSSGRHRSSLSSSVDTNKFSLGAHSSVLPGVVGLGTFTLSAPSSWDERGGSRSRASSMAVRRKMLAAEVRTNIIKRQQSESYTLRTLEELRILCCTRGCTIEDFMGACS